MNKQALNPHCSRYDIALVLLIGCVVSLGAAADQNDPRLEPLFAKLQQTDNARNAKEAERDIWSIWHETPDDHSLDVMQRARQALDADDFPTAVALLDELVAHAPNYAEAWNQRAIVLYIAEDFTGALRDIERTLTLEPRHFGALSGRGRIYMQLDEPEQALEAFAAALQINPWMDNIDSQIQIIRAYLNSKQKPI